MSRKTALARRENAELSLGKELCEQMELFRMLNSRAISHGRPAPYPELYYAVMTMKVEKRGDGYVVTMRKDSLDVRDADLNEHGKSVQRMRSFSERINFRDAHRGRYNDGARLEVGGDCVNDAESIETKEHEAFGSACV